MYSLKVIAELLVSCNSTSSVICEDKLDDLTSK